MSESTEISMGQEQYLLMQQAEGGVYLKDPALTEYIQTVGYKLSSVSDRKDLPYEFIILDNPIPNAWALPGGKIGINRGLLIELKSEAELAAVLSHEIVHSAARHSAKSFGRSILTQIGLFGMQEILKNNPYEPVMMGVGLIGTSLLGLKYSRDAELEADCYGIKYMLAAGYDPNAAIELQKTFLRLSQAKKPHWLTGLFSTHPPSQERIEANEKTVASYNTDIPLIDGQEEYQKAITKLHTLKTADKSLEKGYEALSQGKSKEALSLALEGISSCPEHAHLYNLAGKAQKELCNFNEASLYFQKACDLNPTYFDYYLGLGLCEQALNKKQAHETLEKSLNLFPTAEAHEVLGKIDLTQEKRKEALSHFQLAAYSHSQAGNRAKDLFNKLDLTTHPNNYVLINYTWTPLGSLSLNLTNTSTFSIHDIWVEITFKDLTPEIIRIPAVIYPSTEKTLTTNLLKKPYLQTLKIIKLEIYDHENT